MRLATNEHLLLQVCHARNKINQQNSKSCQWFINPGNNNITVKENFQLLKEVVGPWQPTVIRIRGRRKLLLPAGAFPIAFEDDVGAFHQTLKTIAIWWFSTPHDTLHNAYLIVVGLTSKTADGFLVFGTIAVAHFCSAGAGASAPHGSLKMTINILCYFNLATVRALTRCLVWGTKSYTHKKCMIAISHRRWQLQFGLSWRPKARYTTKCETNYVRYWSSNITETNCRYFVTCSLRYAACMWMQYIVWPF